MNKETEEFVNFLKQIHIMRSMVEHEVTQETFNRAVRVAHQGHAHCGHYPAINFGPEVGTEEDIPCSLDVRWRVGTMDFLVHVPSNPRERYSYYGDRKNGQETEPHVHVEPHVYVEGKAYCPEGLGKLVGYLHDL